MKKEASRKNNRRKYLINPKFQLKFSTYICILLCLSSLIYPLTIYDLISGFISFAAKNNPEYAQTLTDQKNNLFWTLVLWQAGFTGFVYVICIFFSHKIAGPLYKMVMHMKKIRAGENTSALSFRKGDYFQDLAVEFNKTFPLPSEEVAYLDEVNSSLKNLSGNMPEDKKAAVQEVTDKLNTLKDKLTRRR